MSNKIQLEIIAPAPIPAPPTPPTIARSQITTEQLQDLITLIATSNIIALPDGKTWNEVKGFDVTVLPNGRSIVNTRF